MLWAATSSQVWAGSSVPVTDAVEDIDPSKLAMGYISEAQPKMLDLMISYSPDLPLQFIGSVCLK